jgi:steroid 5-alpha reductase family enzyme
VTDTRPAIRVTFASLRPAVIAALAVLYANVGAGDSARRSAIAWMMGSWGARLAIQSLYTPGHRALRDDADAVRGWSYVTLLVSAAFFSLPALISCINPEPGLSPIELGACVLWLVGFAGETTADRQLLRFASNPDHAGLVCRSGVWRIVPDAHAAFETLTWTAFGVFALGSPWGWIALACPAAMAFSLFAPLLRLRR